MLLEQINHLYNLIDKSLLLCLNLINMSADTLHHPTIQPEASGLNAPGDIAEQWAGLADQSAQHAHTTSPNELTPPPQVGEAHNSAPAFIISEETITARVAEANKKREENEVYDAALMKAQDFYAGTFSANATAGQEIRELTHQAAERALKEYRANLGSASEKAEVAVDAPNHDPTLRDEELVEPEAPTTTSESDTITGRVVGNTVSKTSRESPSSPEQPEQRKYTRTEALATLKEISNIDPRGVLSGRLLQESLEGIEPSLAAILPDLLASAQPLEDGYSTLTTSWTDSTGRTYRLKVDYVGGRESLLPGSDVTARAAMKNAARPVSVSLTRKYETDTDRSLAILDLNFPKAGDPDSGNGSVRVRYHNEDPSQVPKRNEGDDVFGQGINPTLSIGTASILGEDLVEGRVHDPKEYMLAAFGARDLVKAITQRDEALQAQPKTRRARVQQFITNIRERTSRS